MVLKLQYCIFTVGGILAPSSGAWKETSFCLMDVVDAVKTDGLLPFFYWGLSRENKFEIYHPDSSSKINKNELEMYTQIFTLNVHRFYFRLSSRTRVVVPRRTRFALVVEP